MAPINGLKSDHGQIRSFPHQKDLVLNLVRRNFILRYKGSVLGVLWSLLLPLAQLLVLVFLFGKVVPLGIKDYPAFVFTALLPWNWFSNCLNSAGLLFFNNRDLVRRPNFAPFTLTIIDALTNLLTFLISLPILFALLFSHGRGITISLLFFPVLVLIQGILIVGMGLIIATLNVFYRDVAHIISVAIMLLFYITPIFYQPQTVSQKYHFVFEWNPMAILIENYRAVLFLGILPEWNSLLIGFLFSAIVCYFGYIIYQNQIHNVIDAI